MKLFYTFFFIIILLTQAWGQGKVKKDQNKVVNIPDNVRKELLSFLMQKHEVVEGVSWINIYNLNNRQDYIFKNDAYYFWGHESPALAWMLVNYNGKIKIFDTMQLDKILEGIVAFNRKENVPIDLQVQYLKGIIRYIYILKKQAKMFKNEIML